jgi:hypothetical protein
VTVGTSLRRALDAVDVLRERAQAQPRVLCVAFLVLSVGAGAAIAAGTHRARSSYRAEAQLTVRAAPGESQQVAWHTLAQALDVARVRQQVAQAGGQQAPEVQVGTRGDPRSALITIYAVGETSAQAQLLANAAAFAAPTFLRETVAPPAVLRSTFEQSSEGWNLGGGLYVLPPEQARPVRTTPHTGAGALEVTCTTVVIGGCGPFLRINRAFLRDTTYETVGWVKGATKPRLRIVLGSTPRDVAVGETVHATAHWRRLAVRWIPQRDVNVARVAFQVMSRGTSRFEIDDVQVGARTAIVHATAPERRTAQYATVLPATSATLLTSHDTGAWAGGGAAGGLLVGGAAALAFVTARRRHPTGATGASGTP